VIKKLRTDFGADEGQTNAWYRHWVELGLAALDPHNSWGFLAFFVLWQAIYAATLFPLLSDLLPRARASEVTARGSAPRQEAR
jgi:hypothetical protein